MRYTIIQMYVGDSIH